MDSEDFAMPSPKRQRTNSPEIISSAVRKGTEEDSTAMHIEPVKHEEIGNQTTTDHSTATEEENEILDTLMQHVEAEVDPVYIPTQTVSNASTHQSIAVTTDSEPRISQSQTVDPPTDKETETKDVNGTSEISTKNTQEGELLETAQHLHTNATTSLPSNERYENEAIQRQRATEQADDIPNTIGTEQSHGGGEGEGGPEWELDSSPYESSSDSLSSDSSSDDDDDSDDDYDTRDLAEVARALMYEDGASDDEGDGAKNKGDGSVLRTANEKPEDVPPIPDITVTEEMEIAELGTVEAVVENNVVIKAKTGVMNQVLDIGSLLCLQNRQVVGAVAETLSRVREPVYTVRLRGEEIERLGLSAKGTAVYYVLQHTSFVPIQSLKAVKGSDASNFHDEEVGDDEMEFSDDEAEAEHKRQLKLKRRGRAGETVKTQANGRGGKGSQRGGYKPSPLSTDLGGAAYGNGSLEMNYDDVQDGDDRYTPLARPANFHEMIKTSNQSSEAPNSVYMPPPSFSDRGRGRSSHRGGRNHDRGGRGGRNGGRGNGNNNRGSSFQYSQRNNYGPTNPESNAYAYSSSPSQQQQQHQPGPISFPQTPSAPSLTPQNPPYPYPTNPSPISPLPASNFNFGNGFPTHSLPSLPQPAPGSTFAYQHQQHQQQQQQQQWNQPMHPGFTPAFDNPAMMQFARQFQQGQHAQHQWQAQAQAQAQPQWQVNQAAAAEVQRQLDEMRKNQR